MKLRSQILTYGLCGAAMATMVGGIGLIGGHRQATAEEEMLTVNAAALATMDGDMMHDAIRGDVMVALLSALTKDDTGMAEARKHLAEHTQRFEKSLHEMTGKGLPPELEKTIEETVILVKAYSDGGDQLQKVASTDPAAAQAMMPGFEKLFSVLEDHMETLSESIDTVSKERLEASAATARVTTIGITAGLLAAITLLMAGAFWLARKMALPMQYAAEHADRIAQGDLSESVATASVQIAQGNIDCRPAPKARPARWRKPQHPWSNSTPPCGKTPTARSRPASWPPAPAPWPCRAARWSAQVVDTMHGINASSQKISDIIGVIDSTLPSRPTSWRSMPPWKPPARASRAGALRWWPVKCAAWQGAAPRPRARSNRSSAPACSAWPKAAPW
jgi:hypothetical protein